MEIINGDQIKIVVFSLIMGLIFGFLYDIIRIIHILCGTVSYSPKDRHDANGIIPAVFLGAGDVIYMLAVAVMFSVFVYAVNNGDFRWFIAAGCAAGCALYHMTLGRLVMLVSGTVANAVRTVIKYVIVKPVVFVSRWIYRILLGRLLRLVCNMIREIKTDRIRRSFGSDIRFDEEKIREDKQNEGAAQKYGSADSCTGTCDNLRGGIRIAQAEKQRPEGAG